MLPGQPNTGFGDFEDGRQSDLDDFQILDFQDWNDFEILDLQDWKTWISRCSNFEFQNFQVAIIDRVEGNDLLLGEIRIRLGCISAARVRIVQGVRYQNAGESLPNDRRQVERTGSNRGQQRSPGCDEDTSA